MKRIKNGLIFVYTFKEGLLSSVAHDLEIQLKSFTVDFNGGDVVAKFDMNSLVVIGAMQNGRPQSGALSAKDKAKIENTIRKEILLTNRYPHSELAARVTDGLLSGTLTLVGRSAAVSGEVNSANGLASGSVEIKPMNWGIKPYSALFGALKLQDRVRIEFQMDLPV